MFIQIILGLVAASFLEWTVHKHILHELGKKKVSIFSFHWGVHHAKCRRNRFHDEEISAREIFGVFSLCALVSPLWLLLPFMYYAMFAHAMTYLVVHNLFHRYPKLAKKYLPWHYDHHMGKNQNTNWCVVHPLADFILGTRNKYEYKSKPNATRSSKKEYTSKRDDS